jgi:hypothetical protein
MKTMALAAPMLLLAGSVQAEPRVTPDMRICLARVLRSEELPSGPLFQHTIKATLLVTAPGRPPFETTVYNMISWQMPLPRQGQGVRVWCDPLESISSGIIRNPKTAWSCHAACNRGSGRSGARSKSWIEGFSSTHSAMVFAGGVKANNVGGSDRKIDVGVRNIVTGLPFKS